MEIVFKYPAMFFFVLIIPIIIALHYYFFEHNKKRAMKFSNFAAMKRVTGTTLITKNTSQLILRIIVISLLILSSTQPVLWHEGNTNILDYVIAIDTSSSMVSEDVYPSRFDLAKETASAFLKFLDTKTNIGLISFAGVSFIEVPLTTKVRDIKEALDNIEIQLSGGTDIGAALVTSVNMLNPGDKSKAIILITDGSDTAGGFIESSLDIGINYAKNNHIIVHTLGIGTGVSQAGYIGQTKLRAVYNKEVLKQISEKTNGRYFDIKNIAEAQAAFKIIGSESEKAKVPFELSPLVLALGFILLLVEWGLLNTRFRALP